MIQQIGDALGAVVRPLIALTFAIVACAAFLLGRLNADQWLALAIMAISWYFSTKTAENAAKQNSRPRRATDVQVDQADIVNVQQGGKK